MLGLGRSSAVISGLGSQIPNVTTFVPVRTHLGYIARQGPANPRANSWEKTKLQLSKVNMKPVKKIHYKFDPFHPKPHSIMQVMTHLSSEKIQKSNPKCLWKTEVVCDRSEPTLTLELNEGNSLMFKTANLQVLEILSTMNEYVLPHVKEETAPVTETKGAAGTDTKGKSKSAGKKKK